MCLPMGIRAEVPHGWDLWVGKKCISIAFQNLDSVLYIILEIRICQLVTLSFKKTLTHALPLNTFFYGKMFGFVLDHFLLKKDVYSPSCPLGVKRMSGHL